MTFSEVNVSDANSDSTSIPHAHGTTITAAIATIAIARRVLQDLFTIQYHVLVFDPLSEINVPSINVRVLISFSAQHLNPLNQYVVSMAQSRGERRKTRHKLKKSSRKRGLSPVSKAIQEFGIGDMVHIIIDPSIHKGMPHHKFHGKTGKVTSQRGRAYLLSVKDGNATKEVITYPQHLSPQR